MNGVEEALFGRIGTAGPASENEYTGKDGLRYCRKCHEPTQCRIVFMGSKQRTSDCSSGAMSVRENPMPPPASRTRSSK